MSLGFDTAPARKGATSARREELDPINLVKKIMDKFPQAGVDEICRKVRSALAGPDARYQDAFNNYATRNHFNLLHKDELSGSKRIRVSTAAPTAVATTSAKVIEQRAAAKTAAVARTAPIIKNITNIVLMNLPTPFGKPLGDLNECEGRKLSGWQATVFNGVGKRKLRDVKSEADLQTAFAKVIK
jgi:hypothetical protein